MCPCRTVYSMIGNKVVFACDVSRDDELGYDVINIFATTMRMGHGGFVAMNIVFSNVQLKIAQNNCVVLSSFEWDH